MRPEEEAEWDMISLGSLSVLDRLEMEDPSELEDLRSEHWLGMVMVLFVCLDFWWDSRRGDEEIAVRATASFIYLLSPLMKGRLRLRHQWKVRR